MEKKIALNTKGCHVTFLGEFWRSVKRGVNSQK